MHIRVVFAGRNYDRTQAVPARLELPDGATVEDALENLQRLLAREGIELPPSCLIAVSGVHLGTLRAHQVHPLCDGDELLLLAPVAGG